MTADPNPTRALLERLNGGDRSAEGELVGLVYDELRDIAARQMRGQRSDHTLQVTALVHEAFVRLVGSEDRSRWNSRSHFLGAATRAMRSALVDHARRKKSAKRGGDFDKLPMDALVASFEKDGTDVLALDEALTRLHELDPQAHRLVELRAFGGLTLEEAGEVLGVSERTCVRMWRKARMWLRRELER